MTARRASLALLLLAVLSGSSGCAVEIHARTVQLPRAVPATTLDAAKQILLTYQAGKSKADAERSPTLLKQYQTAPKLELDAAAYKIQSGLRKPLQVLARYDSPRFFIPRLQAYPHWFAVETSNATDSGHRSSYLVFEKSSVVGSWKLSLATTNYAGAKLPTVALDHAGYARPAVNTRLVVPLGDLAKSHADVLKRGADSPSQGRFNRDASTDQLRKQDADQVAQTRLLGSAEHAYKPRSNIYSLVTVDGGALVFYSVDRTYDIEATARFAFVSLGREIPFLTGKRGRFRSLIASGTEEFAASVPKSGKVSVIGHEGGLTSAIVK